MAVNKVSQRGFVKKDYFDAIMNKVILSMFDIELM